MRYIIVDDDKFFCDAMSGLLGGAPETEDAEIRRHGFDDVELSGIEDDDVFFLDIADGSDENAGIRLARRIREENDRAHIVFITSYERKVRDTITGLIRPSGFLVKPICGVEEEKLRAFLKLLHEKDNKTISLKSGTKYFDVAVKDIIYIRKTDRKTSVYTENSFYQVRQTFVKILKELDDNFIVVDKGAAVNIKKALAYEPATRLIHMEGGVTVYCSRDRAKMHRDILNRLEVI